MKNTMNLFDLLELQAKFSELNGERLEVKMVSGESFSATLFNFDPVLNQVFMIMAKTVRIISVESISSLFCGSKNNSIQITEEEKPWKQPKLITKAVLAAADSALKKYMKKVNYRVKHTHKVGEIDVLITEVTLGPYARGFQYQRGHKRKLRQMQRTDEITGISTTIEKYNNVAPTGLPKNYWEQRFRLFHHFDKGILLDNESFFSVTPERIAEHISERCRSNDFIVDVFCGCGGNLIQFAKTCERVVGIDIDMKKLDYAKVNAGIYGIKDRIEVIQADAVDFLLNFDCYFRKNTDSVDIIFMSPPWGGPDYKKATIFDLKTFKLSSRSGASAVSLFDLIILALKVGPLVACFLPRNVNQTQLQEVAVASGRCCRVELEKHIVSKKVKTCCAYFGDFNI